MGRNIGHNSYQDNSFLSPEYYEYDWETEARNRIHEAIDDANIPSESRQWLIDDLKGDDNSEAGIQLNKIIMKLIQAAKVGSLETVEITPQEYSAVLNFTNERIDSYVEKNLNLLKQEIIESENE